MPDPSLIKQVLKMVGHTKKLLPFIITSTHLDWAKKSYKFRPLRAIFFWTLRWVAPKEVIVHLRLDLVNLDLVKYSN